MSCHVVVCARKARAARRACGRPLCVPASQRRWARPPQRQRFYIKPCLRHGHRQQDKNITDSDQGEAQFTSHTHTKSAKPKKQKEKVAHAAHARNRVHSHPKRSKAAPKQTRRRSRAHRVKRRRPKSTNTSATDHIHQVDNKHASPPKGHPCDSLSPRTPRDTGRSIRTMLQHSAPRVQSSDTEWTTWPVADYSPTTNRNKAGEMKCKVPHRRVGRRTALSAPAHKSDQ
jgi:hypothetical protein